MTSQAPSSLLAGESLVPRPRPNAHRAPTIMIPSLLSAFLLLPVVVQAGEPVSASGSARTPARDHPPVSLITHLPLVGLFEPPVINVGAVEFKKILKEDVSQQQGVQDSVDSC